MAKAVSFLFFLFGILFLFFTCIFSAGSSSDDLRLSTPMCDSKLSTPRKIFVYLAPDGTDCSLEPHAVRASSKSCSLGSIDSGRLSSRNTSIAWSDYDPLNPGISLFANCNPISDKISKLQDLKDVNTLKKELAEVINILEEYSKQENCNLFCLVSLVNMKLSFYRFGYEMCTLLHLTILELGSVDLVGKLINFGANVNAKFMATDCAGEALRKCKGALNLAEFIGNKDIVSLLAQKGAVNSCVSTPMNPLFSSMSLGDSFHIAVDSPQICLVKTPPIFSPKIVISPYGDSMDEDDTEKFVYRSKVPCGSPIFDSMVQSDSRWRLTKIEETLNELREKDFSKESAEESSIVIFLGMIVNLIEHSKGDESNRPELIRIINKPFSVLSLGYEMCTLLHLFVIELPIAVKILVDCGADIHSEFRLVQYFAQEKTKKLVFCRNALDLAVCIENEEIARLLVGKGAKFSECFSSNLGISSSDGKTSDGKKKKKTLKPSCAIV